METRDDAGFIPFGGGLLLQTTDFFTPIVDDPYRFGQIAAANAFSDVYAMGGEPLTAMNLVAFPCSLDLGVLREILAGGLSVTGFVEQDRVVGNAGAKAGDALVLTKPLGLGILTTALKRDIVSEEEIEDAVQMASLLNKEGCHAMGEVGVSAATDVTGYGFLGHLSEMLEASGVGAVVHRDDVPVWERAVPLANDGVYPGGLKSNREYLENRVTADGVGQDELLPLYDPQTSGGLLVALPEERAPALVRALEGRGTLAAVVGEVVALYLRRDGHDVVSAADGEEALDLFRLTDPELVVLDLMLPKLSGLEVCRRMQAKRRVPLIMLTARGEEEERIVGLSLGADDYVVKPFSPRELAARVAAVLRRVEESSGDGDQRVLSFDGLRIDPNTREVLVWGETVTLTAREFDLLYRLASNPGRVYTRDQLMESVWGYTFSADTSTVTVHVRRLREKMESDPARPRYLQTVWGIGYKFGG